MSELRHLWLNFRHNMTHFDWRVYLKPFTFPALISQKLFGAFLGLFRTHCIVNNVNLAHILVIYLYLWILPISVAGPYWGCWNLLLFLSFLNNNCEVTRTPLNVCSVSSWLNRNWRCLKYISRYLTYCNCTSACFIIWCRNRSQ